MRRRHYNLDMNRLVEKNLAEQHVFEAGDGNGHVNGIKALK